jgi:hypothetical protein
VCHFVAKAYMLNALFRVEAVRASDHSLHYMCHYANLAFSAAMSLRVSLRRKGVYVECALPR